MGELDLKTVVWSVTIFIAVAYIACSAFYAVLPQQTATFFSYMFHGLAIKIEPLTLTGFLIGFMEMVILSLIGSALFVWLYNRIAKIK